MADSDALSAEIKRREAERAMARSEDCLAQDWIQIRWKTEKHREEQDHVGSERLMRSRQMRHDSAPEDEEVRNDWILERSAGVVVDERPVKSK